MYHSPDLYGGISWPPRLRRAVYQIYRSSRHLLELIDDVLTLSHFEMTGFILNREPVSIESLVGETVEIAADLFEGRPVGLEMAIATSLPALEIDRTRIRQVLLNLLSNASRFTESGTVQIEAVRNRTDVVISVSDTGSGIPAAKLPHIFSEFYQVDPSLQRRQGGCGLGLAISKHFVEAHDGRIWVESAEGVGSTFFFSLPVPGESVPLSRLHRDPLAHPVQRETVPSVLVADSDPHVAAQVRNLLPGYEVVQVEERAHLGRHVQLHHPQAVVYNVPPGTLGSQGSGISSQVPIIECSLPSESWLADDLAVAACLTKPIRAGHLLQVIEQVGSVRDVLIVDDDRGFRQLVEQILEAGDKSLDVRHASDGEECLKTMRERPPDLLLLDLVMPQLDGFSVMAEMRQDPELADVAVVLLTATSFAETALMQRDSSIAIRRPGGLSPNEVLRCLQAVIAVLEPRYDERSVPGEAMLPLGMLTTAN